MNFWMVEKIIGIWEVDLSPRLLNLNLLGGEKDLSRRRDSNCFELMARLIFD